MLTGVEEERACTVDLPEAYVQVGSHSYKLNRCVCTRFSWSHERVRIRLRSGCGSFLLCALISWQLRNVGAL